MSIHPEAPRRQPERIRIPEAGEVTVIEGISLSGCVDARRSVSDVIHDVRAVRRPGASFGDVTTLAAVLDDLDVEQVVGVIVGYEYDNDRIPVMHSGEPGCGHRARLEHGQYEGSYGIPAQRVRALGAVMDKKAQEGVVAVPFLEGRHEERGVLIVDSLTHTVDPTDSLGNQFFRYDRTRALLELRALGQFASTTLQRPVEFDDLIAAHTTQLNTTLGLLAPGLPIYNIDLTGQTPVITPMGTVPRL